MIQCLYKEWGWDSYKSGCKYEFTSELMSAPATYFIYTLAARYVRSRLPHNPCPYHHLDRFALHNFLLFRLCLLPPFVFRYSLISPTPFLHPPYFVIQLLNTPTIPISKTAATCRRSRRKTERRGGVSIGIATGSVTIGHTLVATMLALFHHQHTTYWKKAASHVATDVCIINGADS